MYPARRCHAGVRCITGAGNQLATCHGPSSPSARQTTTGAAGSATKLRYSTPASSQPSLTLPAAPQRGKGAEVESFQRKSRGVPVDERKPALLLRSVRPSADPFDPNSTGVNGSGVTIGSKEVASPEAW